MQTPISLLWYVNMKQSQWNIQIPPCLLALDCPADWKEFEGSCYKVVNKFSYSRKFVWSTASRVCPGFGGDLVSISNEREMGFVYNLSSPFRSTPVWIGLAYRFQKGEYLWSNGESFNDSFPVKWLGDRSSTVCEDKCVEILGSGWNLTKCCKENKYFICERAKGKLFLRKHLIRKKLRIGGVVFLS